MTSFSPESSAPIHQDYRRQQRNRSPPLGRHDDTVYQESGAGFATEDPTRRQRFDGFYMSGGTGTEAKSEEGPELSRSKGTGGTRGMVSEARISVPRSQKRHRNNKRQDAADACLFALSLPLLLPLAVVTTTISAIDDLAGRYHGLSQSERARGSAQNQTKRNDGQRGREEERESEIGQPSKRGTSTRKNHRRKHTGVPSPQRMRSTENTMSDRSAGSRPVSSAHLPRSERSSRCSRGDFILHAEDATQGTSSGVGREGRSRGVSFAAEMRRSSEGLTATHAPGIISQGNDSSLPNRDSVSSRTGIPEPKPMRKAPKASSHAAYSNSSGRISTSRSRDTATRNTATAGRRSQHSWAQDEQDRENEWGPELSSRRAGETPRPRSGRLQRQETLFPSRVEADAAYPNYRLTSKPADVSTKMPWESTNRSPDRDDYTKVRA